MTDMPPPPAFSTDSYPEPSQATTVLVLGILGLVVCGILGPIAWYLGNQEIAAVGAGRRSPQNISNAKVGRILGIITTVLLALGILLLIILIPLGILAGSEW